MGLRSEADLARRHELVIGNRNYSSWSMRAWMLLRLTGLHIALLPVPVQAKISNIDTRQVDALFAKFREPGSPGCAVGVIQDGSIIYRNNYGLANLELNVPLSDNSVFYLGSVSKQFTAAATLLAAQQGKLALDDDLRKWVPEIPDYGHKITIRNLINHTSGLRNYYPLLYLAGRAWEERRTNDELIDLIAHQKEQNFAPGERFEYSNSNYLLLAEIVRRATGKPLSAFAKENIFDPLGMTNTRFYDDSTVVVPNRVAAYEARPEGGYKVAWSTMFDTVGAGGVMSTIEDLQRWDANFYSGQVGGQSFLDDMQRPGTLNNGTKTNYAAGLGVYVDRGLPVVEHSGGLFGYRTDFLRYPTQHFSVITLCNRPDGNPGGISRQIAKMYIKDAFRTPPPVQMQAIAAPRSLPPSPKAPEHPVLDVAQLSAFAGNFKSEETGAIYRISLVGDELMLRNGWNPAFKLSPVAVDTFRGDFLTLEFRRDAAGRVTEISVATPYTRHHSFTRIGG